MSPKHIYLVDTENVGNSLILGLPDDSKVIYFTRDKVIDNLELNEENIVVYDIKGHNALDFIIDSYIGYLIAKNGSDVKYYIFSKDKGYECIKYFWAEYDVDIQLIQESIVDWNSRISDSLSTEKSVIISMSDDYVFYTTWFGSLKDKQKIHLRSIYKNWSISKKREYDVLKSLLYSQFNISKEASVTLADFIYTYGLMEVK